MHDALRNALGVDMFAYLFKMPAKNTPPFASTPVRKARERNAQHAARGMQLGRGDV